MAQKVSFLKSAVDPKDYPAPDRLEVAITGRSNAGKSSLINAMTGSLIAKVSATPGKTRLVNFFDIGESYRLVDLPGYGWAARSIDEMQMWQSMIENYLSMRSNLAVIVLVMDIRRMWDQDEELLKMFCQKVGRKMALVLTKADKCTKGEVEKFSKHIQRQSGIEHVYAVSTTKNFGVKEMENDLFHSFIKNSKVMK